MSSNLREAISFYFGLKEPNFVQNLKESERYEVENIFEGSTENNAKTGRYLKREEDEENEDVPFFNYTTAGGWWYIEEEDEDKKEKIYLFNKDGQLQDKQQPHIQELHLSQVKRIDEITNYSLKSYDYTMILAYSKDSDSLASFRSQFNRKYNNLAISQVCAHSNNKLYRITLVLTSLDQFIKVASSPKDQISIYQLLKAVQPVSALIVPCIVREEVKEYVEDFLDEDDLYELVKDYVNFHRFDFIYDSDEEGEGEVDEDSDEDGGENSDEDQEEDLIAQIAAQKKNKQTNNQADDEDNNDGPEDEGSEEDDEDEEEEDDSDSDSDEDDGQNKQKIVFVEKKVEE